MDVQGSEFQGEVGGSCEESSVPQGLVLGLSVPQKSKVGRLPANGRLHGDLEHFRATPGSPGGRRGKRGANCSMNVG